jgi:hypothetical protein
MGRSLTDHQDHRAALLEANVGGPGDQVAGIAVGDG